MGRRKGNVQLTASYWLGQLGDWFVPVPETGCWIWMRSTWRGGYGHQWCNGRLRGAHRVSYELLRGPIPEGMDIDHLCRTPSCVNPDHMEPVSTRTNVMRGVGTASINHKKTHCRRGHEYTPENTYEARGKRYCRECRSLAFPVWNEKRRMRKLEGRHNAALPAFCG